MGGKSSVKTENVNRTVADSIIKVSKLCAAEAVNGISLGADKVGGDVVISGKVKQKAKTALRCDQQSDISAAIKSEMISAIRSKALTQDNNLFSGDVGIYSQSSTKNRTVNENIINMNIDDLAECYNTAKNEFEAAFGEVEGNFTFNTDIDQKAKASTLECVQASDAVNELITSLGTDVASSAKDQGTLATLFDSSGNTMATIFIIVAVVVVIGLIGYLVYMMKKQPSSGDGGASK